MPLFTVMMKDRHHARGGDLPVTFAENQISVTLVPFLLRFKIGAAFHADASLLTIETLVVNSCSLTSGLEQVARQLRISGITTYRSDRDATARQLHLCVEPKVGETKCCVTLRFDHPTQMRATN
jgi:hypothetical protein